MKVQHFIFYYKKDYKKECLESIASNYFVCISRSRLANFGWWAKSSCCLFWYGPQAQVVLVKIIRKKNQQKNTNLQCVKITWNSDFNVHNQVYWSTGTRSCIVLCGCSVLNRCECNLLNLNYLLSGSFQKKCADPWSRLMSHRIYGVIL